MSLPHTKLTRRAAQADSLSLDELAYLVDLLCAERTPVHAAMPMLLPLLRDTSPEHGDERMTRRRIQHVHVTHSLASALCGVAFPQLPPCLRALRGALRWRLPDEYRAARLSLRCCGDDEDPDEGVGCNERTRRLAEMLPEALLRALLESQGAMASELLHDPYMNVGALNFLDLYRDEDLEGPPYHAAISAAGLQFRLSIILAHRANPHGTAGPAESHAMRAFARSVVDSLLGVGVLPFPMHADARASNWMLPAVAADSAHEPPDVFSAQAALHVDLMHDLLIWAALTLRWSVALQLWQHIRSVESALLLAAIARSIARSRDARLAGKAADAADAAAAFDARAHDLIDTCWRLCPDSAIAVLNGCSRCAEGVQATSEGSMHKLGVYPRTAALSKFGRLAKALSASVRFVGRPPSCRFGVTGLALVAEAELVLSHRAVAVSTERRWRSGAYGGGTKSNACSPRSVWALYCLVHGLFLAAFVWSAPLQPTVHADTAEATPLRFVRRRSVSSLLRFVLQVHFCAGKVAVLRFHRLVHRDFASRRIHLPLSPKRMAQRTSAADCQCLFCPWGALRAIPGSFLVVAAPESAVPGSTCSGPLFPHVRDCIPIVNQTATLQPVRDASEALA